MPHWFWRAAEPGVPQSAEGSHPPVRSACWTHRSARGVPAVGLRSVALVGQSSSRSYAGSRPAGASPRGLGMTSYARPSGFKAIGCRKNLLGVRGPLGHHMTVYRAVLLKNSVVAIGPAAAATASVRVKAWPWQRGQIRHAERSAGERRTSLDSGCGALSRRIRGCVWRSGGQCLSNNRGDAGLRVDADGMKSGAG